MASLATGRTGRRGLKGSWVTAVLTWIFQPMSKPGNQETESGRPVAKEVMPGAFTPPNTNTTAASISTPGETDERTIPVQPGDPEACERERRCQKRRRNGRSGRGGIVVFIKVGGP
jgi:hypothetical protein